MYESYWQLQCNPFAPARDERFYYPSQSHRAALAKLHWAIAEHRSAALLCGGISMGKTLLLRVLCRQLDAQVAPVAQLVFPQMEAASLLAYVAAELGANGRPRLQDRAAASVYPAVRAIGKFLRSNAERQQHALVVIDEAQAIQDVAAWEALRLLLNLEATSAPMTLILAGQPALLTTIDRCPPLEARIAVQGVLTPLSREETAAYVAHRLRAAGTVRPIFEPQALGVLHELSGGVPGRINRLAALALLLACSEETRTVSATQVETVAQDLAPVSR